ncbi:hydroxylysine kinase-like [Tubulanus polymorphus]|uniref:hydroxylysine kinase-like n=1 Tax=Tubulanus polymorphus TaxID=672921 RepID=UPI003DA6854A
MNTSPGDVIAPNVSEKQIHELVKSLYGFTIRKMKALNGYDDKNFYVQFEENFDNPNIKQLHPDGYVFKVTNTEDSKNLKSFDRQLEFMQRLVNAHLPVQAPILNKEGSFYSLERIYTNGVLQQDATENETYKEHLVRLFTFIPGQILDKTSDVTPELLYEIGAVCGKMDCAIEDMTDGGLHQMIWNLKNVLDVREYMYVLQDADKHKLISDIFNDYETYVVPNLHDLKKVMIHGDFNEQNILIDTRIDENGVKKLHVAGILDFGDINMAYKVFEVATLMMYCTSSVAMSHIDFMDVCAQCLAGYLSQVHLNDLEMSMIPLLVASRYAQSLTLGAYTHSLDTSNDYVLATSRRGWDMLRKLRNIPKGDLLRMWKDKINGINRSKCS